MSLQNLSLKQQKSSSFHEFSADSHENFKIIMNAELIKYRDPVLSQRNWAKSNRKLEYSLIFCNSHENLNIKFHIMGLHLRKYSDGVPTSWAYIYENIQQDCLHGSTSKKNIQQGCLHRISQGIFNLD
jgi:hypothetical protein